MKYLDGLSPFGSVGVVARMLLAWGAFGELSELSVLTGKKANPDAALETTNDRYRQ